MFRVPPRMPMPSVPLGTAVSGSLPPDVSSSPASLQPAWQCLCTASLWTPGCQAGWTHWLMSNRTGEGLSLPEQTSSTAAPRCLCVSQAYVMLR